MGASDLTDVDNILIVGTPDSDNFILEPFNGRLKLYNPDDGIETHLFDAPTTSISIDLGDGDGFVVVCIFLYM